MQTGNLKTKLIRTNSPLLVYLFILAFLCFAVIASAMQLEKQGAYLAQLYMITPALAAIITRTFFYQRKFTDANLRFGRLKDYIQFWLISLGITAVSFAIFTLLGAISWDFSGEVFLQKLEEQFAGSGQDISATLPPGFTPKMMLLLFFLGGLTLFNIIPGVITGFGEEFGHRGFMFPLLFKITPWAGFLLGGLLWYAWHWPLILVIPPPANFTFWQKLLNFFILGAGSICTFTYLSYVYVKTRNVWVTSIAHIAMNNSATSFSYFAIAKNQLLANAGLTLTMILIIIALYYLKEFRVFRSYFQEQPNAMGDGLTGND